MRWTLKTIVIRVIAGVLISLILGLLHRAHADPSCPSGQVVRYKITIVGPTGSQCPVTCSLNQTFTDRGAIRSCVPAGGQCADPNLKWSTYYRTDGPTITADASAVERDVVDVNGTAVNYGGVAYAPECAAPPPAPTNECQPGQHYNGTQCIADHCPDAGTKEARSPMANGNGNYCTKVDNGTLCGISVEGGLNVCAMSGGTCGVWSEVKYTGSTCTEENTAPPGPIAPISTPAGSFTPDASQAGSNGGCGYLDGEYKCLEKPTGSGKCTLTKNGGSFCVLPSDTSKPTDIPLDNGKPGRNVPPDAVATHTDAGGATTGTTNIYSPGTTAAASNKPTPSDQPSDKDGKCGATGQEKCGVKIDETGVPQSFSTNLDQAYGHNAQGDAEAITGKASESPVGGHGVEEFVGMAGELPNITGSCATITVPMTWLGSTNTLTFPRPEDCGKFQTFRDWFGLLFAMGIAAYAIARVINP